MVLFFNLLLRTTFALTSAGNHAWKTRRAYHASGWRHCYAFSI